MSLLEWMGLLSEHDSLVVAGWVSNEPFHTHPAPVLSRINSQCSGKRGEGESQYAQHAKQGLLLPHVPVPSGDGDHLAGAGRSLRSQGWFCTYLTSTAPVGVEPKAPPSPQRVGIHKAARHPLHRALVGGDS